MARVGIKLVWAGWKDDPIIGFNEKGYQKWRGTLTPGTRVLIYETSLKASPTVRGGQMAIVGEVEVTGTFEEGAAYSAPNKEHTRLLPVRVITSREQARPVRLDAIRKLLRTRDFPPKGAAWIPLTDAHYKALVALLNPDSPGDKS
jgi:hypothetical protein